MTTDDIKTGLCAKCYYAGCDDFGGDTLQDYCDKGYIQNNKKKCKNFLDSKVKIKRDAETRRAAYELEKKERLEKYKITKEVCEHCGKLKYECSRYN